MCGRDAARRKKRRDRGALVTLTTLPHHQICQHRNKPPRVRNTVCLGCNGDVTNRMHVSGVGRQGNKLYMGGGRLGVAGTTDELCYYTHLVLSQFRRLQNALQLSRAGPWQAGEERQRRSSSKWEVWPALRGSQRSKIYATVM